MGENVSKIKMHWNFLPEPREALNLWCCPMFLSLHSLQITPFQDLVWTLCWSLIFEI